MLHIRIPEVTRSIPPRHSNPSILSSFFSQSNSFLYKFEKKKKVFAMLLPYVVHKDSFQIDKKLYIYTCTCASKYFKKNPKRKDLPFLKAPAIEMMTTGRSFTFGCNNILSKFSSFSSSPWIMSPPLSSLVTLIICRGLPFSKSSVNKEL